MVKMVSILLILVAYSFAGSIWESTVSKIDIDTAYTIKYGTPFEYTGAVSHCIITKTNDIRDSGFVNDSVKLQTGYRTLFLTYDKNGEKDSVFSAVTWIDTSTLIKGSATNMDTLSVTGFAVHKSPLFLPANAQYIQPVVKPMAGTRVLKSIGWAVLDVIRMASIYTTSK